MILARLPVGYARWQSIGLFALGEMRSPDYALSVFEQHHRAAGTLAPGFAFLELGPGNSLASAVIGKAFGAARCWLVDSGDYASGDMRDYTRLIERLRGMRPSADLDALAAARGADALLATAGARFLTGGLASLRRVPDRSCDFVFSQAVLEHVPRGEFAATIAETRRVLKPGGVASHRIDFRDHLSGSLNNLRFREGVWEAPWFAHRSGFYTNRLRPSEMLAIFEKAGFDVTVTGESRWDRLPIARSALDASFRSLPDADLLIQGASVVLRPKRSGG